MATNPFAALTEGPVSPPAPTEQPAQEQPATQSEQPVVRGGTFVFDFETVPDESRFPRPTKAIPTHVDSLSELLKGGVPDVVKRIEQGMTADQLTELAKLENEAKKPRKGVLDAVDKALTDGDAAFQEWRKVGSVDPFRARICAFGWIDSCNIPRSMTARTDDEERAILRKFWELVSATHKRCGYNIFHFDDMLAVIRSMLLGVEPSRQLDRRKYGNREAIDLMVALFPSGGSMRCKDVCSALGIIPPAGDMDGSKVFDLYEIGDMASIAKYVESDVLIERTLLVHFIDYLQM